MDTTDVRTYADHIISLYAKGLIGSIKVALEAFKTIIGEPEDYEGLLVRLMQIADDEWVESGGDKVSAGSKLTPRQQLIAKFRRLFRDLYSQTRDNEA